ncbi:MAG: ATP-binding protein, partial [Sulfurimonas sp.]|nr:ATP-binding protein [Sulfurimonas sp.]
KLSDIFTRFTRANTYAGGFGVGLNIVESIVKEYEFKIEINSKEKEGTEVIIKF